MRAPWILSSLPFLLGHAPARAEAPSGRPVVAVFSVEDRTSKLSAALLAQLTDYLTAKVAEGGHFYVVPRAQIKARLTEQKKESYKQCYDEKCQIEIGRELAAQKSLSTQIIQIGSKCAVTATLYDLRRAASEGSASDKTGCSEDELVAAVERVAALLKPRLVETVRPAASSGQLLLRSVPAGAQVFIDGVLRGQGPLVDALVTAPGRRRVRVEQPGHEPWEQTLVVALNRTVVAAVRLHKQISVEITSDPAGVRVSLDRQQRGRTPVQVWLVARRSYSLQLDKSGYRALEQPLELASEEPQQLTYRLEPSPEHYGGRSEWLSLTTNLAVGVGGNQGFVAAGGALDVATLKWRYLSWTLLTVGAGGGSDRVYGHGETRLGFPLRFGRLGQHQLRLGAGFGVLVVSEDQLSYIQTRGEGHPPLENLCLSLSAEYTYALRGRLLLGGGFRALIPLGRDLIEGRSGSPSVALLGLRVGFGAGL